MGINIKNVRNLSFEGGGGKGIVYLGAIRALEKMLSPPDRKTIFDPSTPFDFFRPKKKPIINIFQREQGQIRGISGASAGAITAFMISIGMNSDEIEEVMNRTTGKDFSSTFLRKILAPSKYEISLFEAFFQDADSSLNHVVTNKNISEEGKEGEFRYRNYQDLLPFIKWVIITILPTSNLIRDIYSILKKNMSVLNRQLFYNGQTDIFVSSMLFNRGLFAGTAPVEFFTNLLKEFIVKKYKDNDMNIKLYTKTEKPEDFTFIDLYRLTNVNLILMGVNIHFGESRYFSAYHTPKIKVVDALAISMSIPVLFKPVYIDTLVRSESFYNKGESKESIDLYNKRYKGLYVDGGVRLNFPIHAFDAPFETLNVKYYNEEGAEYFISNNFPANEVNIQYPFNSETIGFRLESPTSYQNEMKDVYGDGKKVQNNNYKVSIDFAGKLVETFLYSGGKGQINSPGAAANTIKLDCGLIETTDFSSPKLDGKRKTPSPDNDSQSMKEYKLSLINKAEDDTKKAFDIA